MKFVMNFKADWHDSLRKIMSEKWGMDMTKLITDIPIHYFNAAQRRPSANPRTLLLSDTFSCPSEHQSGWDRLKKSVSEGQDFTPHLSKLVTKPEETDQMLNDWGVYHFHLGTKLQKGFVNRTGPLLFARITDKIFYAIGVYNHGAWTDSEVVETVHRNWPDSVRQWIMRGVPRQRLSDEERGALRKKHLNAFFLTKDGTSYGPIGGGMVASGHNFSSVVQMDIEHDRLDCLERLLVDLSDEITPALKNAGYVDAAEVVAKLVLREEFYSAHFPEYKLLVDFYPRHA